MSIQSWFPRIRDGDGDAWQSLIDRYEGRLLAYTDSRIRNRATSEDIVQDAFVGFLISLPNYDGSRPLESYLFSICGYKLTDHLRREGRRPSVQNCIIAAATTTNRRSSTKVPTESPVPSHAVSNERPSKNPQSQRRSANRFSDGSRQTGLRN